MLENFTFSFKDDIKSELVKGLHSIIIDRLNRGGKCPDTEKYRCLSNQEISEILDHYENAIIDHQISNSRDFENAYGGVDPNFPNIIYLTQLFFEAEEEEQIRTLIHEIAHTMGWDCGNKYEDHDYYYTMPLRAERSATGIATFMKYNIKKSCLLVGEFNILIK